MYEYGLVMILNEIEVLVLCLTFPPKISIQLSFSIQIQYLCCYLVCNMYFNLMTYILVLSIDYKNYNKSFANV